MKIGIKLAIAGILLFLLFFGCPIFSNTQNATEKTIPNTNCDTKDYYSKISCYQGLAMENSSETFCDKIEPKSFLVECYWRVASKVNNLTICDKLSTYGDRHFCYTAFAQETKNGTVCENLPAGYYDVNISKGECYTGVAIALRDKSMCLKISDELTQRGCMYDVNQAISGAYD